MELEARRVLHHHGISTEPQGYVLFLCEWDSLQIKVFIITNPEYLENSF